VFREDLFFRLVVASIEVPPLRDRLEDLPLLAEKFCQELAQREEIPVPIISEEIWKLWSAYLWPGNIRELKNEIERLISFLPKGGKRRKKITEDMLPSSFISKLNAAPEDMDLRAAHDRVTREFIESALTKYKGHKTKAAQALGISRLNMRQHIERLKIKSPKK